MATPALGGELAGESGQPATLSTCLQAPAGLRRTPVGGGGRVWAVLAARLRMQQ